MTIGLLINPDVATSPAAAALFPSFKKKYRKVRRLIKHSIEAGDICHGLINKDYASQRMRRNPYLLFSIDEDKDKINGFATLAMFDEKTIRVSVLCTAKGARGIGIALHDAIEKIAKAVGVDKLVLKSIPEAMSFYEHIGYKLDYSVPFSDESDVEESDNDNSDSDDEFSGLEFVPMSKKLGEPAAAGAGGGKGGGRSRRRQMRSRRTLRARQK